MDWEMNENVVEWKLVDVPELGYLTTDRPFPRGELLLKTRSQIKGYYKHAKVGCQRCLHAAQNPKPCIGVRKEKQSDWYVFNGQSVLLDRVYSIFCTLALASVHAVYADMTADPRWCVGERRRVRSCLTRTAST